MSNSNAIRPGQPRETVQARLVDGRIFEAPPGTPLADILCVAAQPGAPMTAAAVINNKLAELTAP